MQNGISNKSERKMEEIPNSGYDLEVIKDYKKRIALSDKSYLLDEVDEQTDEYVHFYFIGKDNEDEVIYDCILYTLRFQHESELFDIAEHKAAQHFPQYKKIKYEEDENGDLKDEEELDGGLCTGDERDVLTFIFPEHLLTVAPNPKAS